MAYSDTKRQPVTTKTEMTKMLEEANKDVITVFKHIKVSMFMINKKIGNLENHSNGLEKILNMTEFKL